MTKQTDGTVSSEKIAPVRLVPMTGEVREQARETQDHGRRAERFRITKLVGDGAGWG